MNLHPYSTSSPFHQLTQPLLLPPHRIPCAQLHPFALSPAAVIVVAVIVTDAVIVPKQQRSVACVAVKESHRCALSKQKSKTASHLPSLRP